MNRRTATRGVAVSSGSGATRLDQSVSLKRAANSHSHAAHLSTMSCTHFAARSHSDGRASDCNGMTQQRGFGDHLAVRSPVRPPSSWPLVRRCIGGMAPPPPALSLAHSSPSRTGRLAERSDPLSGLRSTPVAATRRRAQRRFRQLASWPPRVVSMTIGHSITARSTNSNFFERKLKSFLCAN